MAEHTLSSSEHRVDLAEAIEFYYEQGWTDGLPVVPATPERVRLFLDAAGRAPGDTVGAVPTRGRVITAEKVAINAVLAGCKPEYMPVLLAAMEAMTAPEFNWHGSLASTMGSAPMIVVSGPVAERIGMNGGVNVFGPGNRANATIGRAVRLIIINVTGGVPGLLDRATLGHGGKYSMCFTENMEHSPWEPLHVQRGFSPEESAVTAMAVQGPHQLGDHVSNTPEALLDTFAQHMSVYGPGHGEFAVAISPEHALIFRNAGWSKRQAAEYLHRVAISRVSERSAIGGATGQGQQARNVVATADGLMLLVAGGDAGGFSSLIPTWAGGNISRSVTRRVEG